METLGNAYLCSGDNYNMVGHYWLGTKKIDVMYGKSYWRPKFFDFYRTLRRLIERDVLGYMFPVFLIIHCGTSFTERSATKLLQLKKLKKAKEKAQIKYY